MTRRREYIRSGHPVKEVTGDFYVVNKSPILDLPIASGRIDV